MNSFEQFKQALSEGNQQTIIEHANTIKKSILRNQYPLDVACQFYELYLPWCCMYDTEAVERNYKQYHAFCANDSNEERRHMLKSLYFMNLLANNNLSAFHCEIELLTESEMSNPYISFTLDLERSLSEGNYNKVLNSFGNFPLESYKGFINKMIETVRNDIDECIFASYNSLDLNTLQKFFYFNTREQLLDYIHTHHKEWIIQEDQVLFVKQTTTQSHYHADDNLNNLLSYAMESENVV